MGGVYSSLTVKPTQAEEPVSTVVIIPPVPQRLSPQDPQEEPVNTVVIIPPAPTHLPQQEPQEEEQEPSPPLNEFPSLDEVD